jgi:hypothetical protein
MKKTYISPSITCIRISANTMLCQSKFTTETTSEEVVADSREVVFDRDGRGPSAWEEW